MHNNKKSESESEGDTQGNQNRTELHVHHVALTVVYHTMWTLKLGLQTGHEAHQAGDNFYPGRQEHRHASPLLENGKI